jgi:hypothetical protein
MAKLGESIKCEEGRFLMSVEMKVRNKSLMQAAKNIDHVLIFKYLHELCYLMVAVSFMRLEYDLFD